MESGFLQEFEVKIGVYQGSVLSPPLFAIVVDVTTEKVKRGVINELPYADDLGLMSEIMETEKRDSGIGRMRSKVRI